MSRRRSRRWRWSARALAVVGSALALWLVLRRIDLGALATTLRTMRVGWYAAAQALFGTGLLVSGLRWHLMLRLNHQAVVHGAASVRMVFMSQFFNTALGGPSSGDVPKTALYARWFGVPWSDALAASVLDRMVASVGGLIFATAAVALGASAGAFRFVDHWEWHLPGRWILGIGAGLAVVAVAILAWGLRHPQSFIGRALRSLQQSARRLLGSGRRSAQAIGCAVAAATLFNLTQVLCLQAVVPEPISWLKLLWMYHVVTFVAALPITVAGTGLREGASMVLLGAYGVSPAAAVAAALLTLSIHVTWAAAGAALLAREQRLRRRAPRPAPPAGISAVIPALNEAHALPETLASLQAVPEITEVLVVDGGSTDGTPDLARRLGCRVLTAPRSRGAQLRAGAEAARGDVVLLIHADTALSRDAGAALLRCLRDPLVVGGGFWKRFRDPPWIMRGARFRCWLRLWWSGRILGDQALFVRRAALESVGGVPDQPLMEEIELCRRLRRLGRLALAGASVVASERRFREHGVFRTYWVMWRVTRGYRRGVAPEQLVKLYEQG